MTPSAVMQDEFLGIGRTWVVAVIVIALATLLIWFGKVGETTYATIVITIFSAAGGVKAYHKRLSAKHGQRTSRPDGGLPSASGADPPTVPDSQAVV